MTSLPTPQAPAPKKGLKPLHIIGLVLVGLFAVCVVPCAGFVYYIGSNADELKAKGERLGAEGKVFGEGKPADMCLPESLARSRAAKGILETAMYVAFEQGCYEVAAPSETVCVGVPSPSDFSATVLWRSSRCQSNGLADMGCQPLHEGLQRYCHGM